MYMNLKKNKEKINKCIVWWCIIFYVHFGHQSVVRKATHWIDDNNLHAAIFHKFMWCINLFTAVWDHGRRLRKSPWPSHVRSENFANEIRRKRRSRQQQQQQNTYQSCSIHHRRMSLRHFWHRRWYCSLSMCCDSYRNKWQHHQQQVRYKDCVFYFCCYHIFCTVVDSVNIIGVDTSVDAVCVCVVRATSSDLCCMQHAYSAKH